MLIAGGGIGGLATAIAFAKRGMQARVLERSHFAEESGAGIQLGPNATRALRELGVLAAIEAVASKPEALILYDALTGQPLASMPLGRAMQERYGAPYLTLHRADLHAALLAACRNHGGIELRQGAAVVAVETTGDTVTAKDAEGGTAEGSCLIAADGLWSTLRPLIAPHAGLRFAGATAWRALLPLDVLAPPFDAANVGLWLGPGAHLVHYPVRGGEQMNLVAVIEGGEAEQGWNTHAEIADFLATCGRWAAPVRDLLGSVQEWRCWSLYRLAPFRPWSQGRMVLLGDAAHPVLPYLAQGAALAIEDAMTLAASFEAAGGDPLLALRRYERLRRPRVMRVQRQSWRHGRLYHLRGTMAGMRNVMLKRSAPARLLNSFDWLYAPRSLDA